VLRYDPNLCTHEVEELLDTVLCRQKGIVSRQRSSQPDIHHMADSPPSHPLPASTLSLQALKWWAAGAHSLVFSHSARIAGAGYTGEREYSVSSVRFNLVRMLSSPRSQTEVSLNPTEAIECTDLDLPIGRPPWPRTSIPLSPLRPVVELFRRLHLTACSFSAVPYEPRTDHVPCFSISTAWLLGTFGFLGINLAVFSAGVASLSPVRPCIRQVP
jgi:hypothetical protein